MPEVGKELTAHSKHAAGSVIVRGDNKKGTPLAQQAPTEEDSPIPLNFGDSGGRGWIVLATSWHDKEPTNVSVMVTFKTHDSSP